MSILPRRQFLQSAAGASLLARPLFLTAQAGSSDSAASATPVRFGIIGVGMQGSGLLGAAIKLPGVECVAMADFYDGRHTLAREITNNPNLPVTRNYRELLDRKDIECVIAAVPDFWHQQVVVDACNAGKDVYCEKPMSHRAEEGFAMVEAAARNKRIVQVGSQRVSSALCAKAHEMYHDGLIGDVTMVELTLGRNSPTGAWEYPTPSDLSTDNFDWNAWQKDTPKIPLDPKRFARWRCWREYGTGVGGDLMVHLLSGMLVTLGWNEPPRSASALGGIFKWKDGRDMPDVHAVLFDYHGVPVYVRLDLTTHTPESARFMGPKGILAASGSEIRYSPQTGKDNSPSYYSGSFPSKMRAEYVAQWHAEHDPPGKEPITTEDTVYKGDDWDDLAPHLWNFFQAVRSRRPVTEDAVFGNHAAIACHMANESFFRQRPVTWDAASRTIKSA